MPIKTITFDWGDTLATNHGQPYDYVHRRALDQLQEELNGYGAALPDDWSHRCDEAWQAVWLRTADPKLNPEHEEPDQLAMFHSWIDEAPGSVSAAQRDAAIRHFSEHCLETVLAYDGAGETLATLAQRGYRIGILSHISWHRAACEAWFERRGWTDRIHFLSLSSDVGRIKPHPDHYQHALDQANCSIDELLHVGDHPLRDIDGGKAFGFKTCLRRTGGIYDPKLLAACEADIEVAHIKELLGLIDEL